jgi:hypothetical protein
MAWHAGFAFGTVDTQACIVQGQDECNACATPLTAEALPSCGSSFCNGSAITQIVSEKRME